MKIIQNILPRRFNVKRDSSAMNPGGDELKQTTGAIAGALLLLCGGLFPSLASAVGFTYANTTIGSLAQQQEPGGGACAVADGFTRDFVVGDDFTVDDLIVGLDVDHTWRGDLRVTLTSPATTSVVLIAQLAGDSFNDYNVLLSDSHTDPLHNGVDESTPPPEYFREVPPDNLLSAFDGENSLGTWTIGFCNTDVSDQHTDRQLDYVSAELRFDGTPTPTTADLAVTAKIVDDDAVFEGDTITYTVTVTHNGDLDATGVEVTDLLPAGEVTYVSHVASQGGYVPGTGVWTIGSMLTGAVETLDITVTVDSGLSPKDFVSTNTATITNVDQPDPNPSNDSSSVDVRSCPVGELFNIASVTTADQSETDPTNNTDHNCTTLGLDFGDAPMTYGDASHVASSTLFLGTVLPDLESASQYSADATGDDTDGTDDEEGVTFSSGGGSSIVASVVVDNTTGGDVTLCGWMDSITPPPLGNFELAERQCTTSADPSGDFVWNVDPNSAGDYMTRFRVCSTASECDVPTGAASDGEVEDYQISFDPTAVTIGEVGLEAIVVADYLVQLGVNKMGNVELLALLGAWDADAAVALSGASRLALLEALDQYLDPDGDGQVALFRWETLEERGTIGFYAERRNGDDSWSRINQRMLPALVAPVGGEYMLVDPGALSGNTYRYQLIEQEATGKTRTYGPYIVEMP